MQADSYNNIILKWQSGMKWIVIISYFVLSSVLCGKNNHHVCAHMRMCINKLESVYIHNNENCNPDNPHIITPILIFNSVVLLKLAHARKETECQLVSWESHSNVSAIVIMEI